MLDKDEIFNKLNFTQASKAMCEIFLNSYDEMYKLKERVGPESYKEKIINLFMVQGGIKIKNKLLEDFITKLATKLAEADKETGKRILRGTIKNLENKQSIRTAHDVTTIKEMVSLLKEAAYSQKTSIYFHAFCGPFLTKLIEEYPFLFTKIGNLCADVTNNFTPEGKKTFVEELDKMLSSIIPDDETIVKNTLLDGIVDGTVTIAIEMEKED